ncbi:hypothetical protein pb186bvf_020928 [Paramecium bursaria]
MTFKENLIYYLILKIQEFQEWNYEESKNIIKYLYELLCRFQNNCIQICYQIEQFLVTARVEFIYILSDKAPFHSNDIYDINKIRKLNMYKGYQIKLIYTIWSKFLLTNSYVCVSQSNFMNNAKAMLLIAPGGKNIAIYNSYKGKQLQKILWDRKQNFIYSFRITILTYTYICIPNA